MKRKMLTLALSGLSFVSVQHSFASGLFKENENEKKEMNVSSESSSLLQTGEESDNLLYPDDPSLPDGTPIGLPVDGSLAIALFLALLSASYLFIKERWKRFFYKNNTNAMNKKTILVIVFCLFALTGSAQTAENTPAMNNAFSDLEGSWTLEQASVLKITNGDTLAVAVSTVKDNTFIALYDTLVFEANTLTIPHNDDSYSKGEYRADGQIMEFSFMSATHQLEYNIKGSRIYFRQQGAFNCPDCTYLIETVYKAYNHENKN